jgi:hypothetical protein
MSFISIATHQWKKNQFHPEIGGGGGKTYFLSLHFEAILPVCQW